MTIGKTITVGEILKRTFAICKEQYKTYLTTAAFGVAANFVLGYVVYILTRHSSLIGGTIMYIVDDLFHLVYLYVIGACIKIASEQILGREISSGEARRFVWGKFRQLYAAGFLFAMICVIVFKLGDYGLNVVGCNNILTHTGFILIASPYLTIVMALFPQAVMIEGQGAWSSIKRSKALVKGNWWRCFGIFAMYSVVVWSLSFVLALPLDILTGRWFGSMEGMGFAEEIFRQGLGDNAYILIAPFMIIAYTLIFYDLRVREENIDTHLSVDIAQIPK